MFETIRSVQDGTFQSGVRVLGLADGGVDYVYNENNQRWITSQIREQVESLRQQIINGTISVPTE